MHSKVCLKRHLFSYVNCIAPRRVFVFKTPHRLSHTQSHLVFRNHTGLFNLSERRTELLLRLHLMPTQQMYDPVAVKQIKAKALGVTPLPPLGTFLITVGIQVLIFGYTCIAARGIAAGRIPGRYMNLHTGVNCMHLEPCALCP
jgi:hypothetical protein